MNLPVVRRLLDGYARASLPRPDGLPSALVMWLFPGLVLAAIAFLVLLDLNGSSTGMFSTLVGTGHDPDLVLGTPRPIRSDEWLAQGSWVVSQVAQGYPHHNHVFPGGTDATVMNDLPAKDWSMAFRPHTWGFPLLGLDRGAAIRWWLPAGLMVATCYQAVVSILPRAPWVGAGLALFVLFQPVVQWWWLPLLHTPVAFAFATITAVVWGVRSAGWWGRVLPAAAAGYLACDMAMAIYVPFMIPALTATLFAVVGFVLRERHAHGARRVAVGLVPLAGAALLAGGVMAAWVLTRRDALAALTGTSYPGQRRAVPGAGDATDALGLLSAPFQRTLQLGVDAHGIGPNQSESSSTLLLSVFLLVPLLAVSAVRWRRERRVEWLVVTMIAGQAVTLAYLYVPGWEVASDALGLDRGVPQRLRIYFVIVAVLAAATLLEQLAALALDLPWGVALAAGLSVLAVSAWPWLRLRSHGSPAASSLAAGLVTVLVVIGVVLLARGRGGAGVGLLLAGSLVLGAGVNPLYRGVFDLRSQTEAGRAVRHLAAAEPRARWVGVNTYLAMAVLVESGVPAYGGVQTYPAAQMWRDIDPEHEYQTTWNRLAHVYWLDGTGDPAPRQPPGTLDQVHLTFDSCADFAQQHVTFVLADQVHLEQPCLRLVKRLRQGPSRQWIYRVTTGS